MSDPNAAPAAPAAAPAAPAAAPVAAPATPAIPWLPADATADLIGHATNAGWKSPADAVKSHLELQKLFGADRHGRTVVVPKDDAAPEEWAAYYGKLGRPQSPEGYGIKPPEGADGSFAQNVATKLHELGISERAGKELAAWYQEFGSAQAKAAEEAQQAALEQEHNALRKDWGAEHDLRRDLAKRAALKLGLDEAAIDAMEKASGFSKTMKALAQIGDMLRETKAEGFSDTPGSFGMTPEGARVKRQQLMADADWRKKAMVPNSREWAELQSMDRILAGG